MRSYRYGHEKHVRVQKRGVRAGRCFVKPLAHRKISSGCAHAVEARGDASAGRGSLRLMCGRVGEGRRGGAGRNGGAGRVAGAQARGH
jgi:hypothetical protein